MRHICTSIVATLVLAGTTLAATINVPADYTTIQAAVDAASDGDEIIVAPGDVYGFERCSREHARQGDHLAGERCA